MNNWISWPCGQINLAAYAVGLALPNSYLTLLAGQLHGHSLQEGVAMNRKLYMMISIMRSVHWSAHQLQLYVLAIAI